jgi:hypothetical protein
VWLLKRAYYTLNLALIKYGIEIKIRVLISNNARSNDVLYYTIG